MVIGVRTFQGVYANRIKIGIHTQCIYKSTLWGAFSFSQYRVDKKARHSFRCAELVSRAIEDYCSAVRVMLIILTLRLRYQDGSLTEYRLFRGPYTRECRPPSWEKER